MMANLRELDDKDFTFNISSQGGMFRLKSLCRYPQLEDAQKLKKHILLNAQIVRQLQILRSMKNQTCKHNDVAQAENHLDLLLSELRGSRN